MRLHWDPMHISGSKALLCSYYDLCVLPQGLAFLGFCRVWVQRLFLYA